mgnify:CR=1 FL=1
MRWIKHIHSLQIKASSALLKHFLDSEDNIVGYGIGFSDTVEWKQGLIFSKLDSSGALLKSTFLLDSLGEPLAVDKHWGGIIETKNGGYAAIGATVGRESAFLIKLDQNLEEGRQFPSWPPRTNRASRRRRAASRRRAGDPGCGGAGASGRG